MARPFAFLFLIAATLLSCKLPITQKTEVTTIKFGVLDKEGLSKNYTVCFSPGADTVDDFKKFVSAKNIPSSTEKVTCVVRSDTTQSLKFPSGKTFVFGIWIFDKDDKLAYRSKPGDQRCDISLVKMDRPEINLPLNGCKPGSNDVATTTPEDTSVEVIPGVVDDKCIDLSSLTAGEKYSFKALADKSFMKENNTDIAACRLPDAGVRVFETRKNDIFKGTFVSKQGSLVVVRFPTTLWLDDAKYPRSLFLKLKGTSADTNGGDCYKRESLAQRATELDGFKAVAADTGLYLYAPHFCITRVEL